VEWRWVCYVIARTLGPFDNIARRSLCARSKAPVLKRPERFRGNGTSKVFVELIILLDACATTVQNHRCIRFSLNSPGTFAPPPSPRHAGLLYALDGTTSLSVSSYDLH
jgi:hypothetical protein